MERSSINGVAGNSGKLPATGDFRLKSNVIVSDFDDTINNDAGNTPALLDASAQSDPAAEAYARKLTIMSDVTYKVDTLYKERSIFEQFCAIGDEVRETIPAFSEVIAIFARHFVANAQQIELQTLQTLSVMAGVFGVRLKQFYILDLNPSGLGKTEKFKKAKKFFEKPVKDELKSLRMALKEQAKAQSEANPEQKAPKVPKIKWQHNGKMMTPQGLHECFKAQKSHIIFFDEFGKALSNPAVKPLITALLELYQDDEPITPTYKSDDEDEEIEGANLAVSFASTTAYADIQVLRTEFQGGLLNRCIVLYTPESDAYFEEWRDCDMDGDDLELDEANTVRAFGISWCEYAKSIAGLEFERNTITKSDAFCRYVKPWLKSERASHPSEWAVLYARAVTNFIAVTQIFHLLTHFELWKRDNAHTTPSTIDDSTIVLSWMFISKFYDYTALIDLLEGKSSQDDIERVFQRYAKAIADRHPNIVKLKELRSMRLRLNGKELSTPQIIELLEPFYKIDQGEVICRRVK